MLLFVTLVAPTMTTAQWDDCAAGEAHILFGLLTDADSRTEQSWTMTCGLEGVEIWNVSTDNWPANDVEPHQWTFSEACIDSTWTCTFTLKDSYGDGLQEGMGDDSKGYYTLTYNAETIAVYDGQPFLQHVYCVGPSCTSASSSSLESNADSDCDTVYLSITLDNDPTGIQYSVTCQQPPTEQQLQQQQESGVKKSNTVVVLLWNETTLEQVDAGTTMEYEEACVQLATVCCTFSIADASNDGLTVPIHNISDAASNSSSSSSTADTYGKVFLEAANQAIWNYDGSMPGSMFSSYSVQFGGAC
jgi:hypothetical protein